MIDGFIRRKKTVAGLHLALMLIVSTVPAYSQERSEDLTSMSLEELMNVEIVPIGILESHIHLDGEWMVGYHFMRMNMSGSTYGNADYMMSPESMWMDMHMVMLMYGLTDDLTLMAMVPFRRSAMEMVEMGGMRTSAVSEGVGDILLMGHYALARRSKNYVIGGAGITIPTGSIDVSQTSAAGSRRLGYGMQLGAGVPEIALDLTLVRQSETVNAGAHAEGKWSVFRNKNDYHLGDRYHAGAWLTVKLSSWFAPTLHLHAERRRAISGADPEIAVGMSPANDPGNYEGTHLSLAPGITIYAPDGILKGQRLTVKIEYPIAERHSPHFLEKGWSIVTGWQWTL